jgi:hypothetical protein
VTVAIRAGRVYKPAVPATSAPAASGYNSADLTIAGMSESQAHGPVCAYIGVVASGVPTTYASLANPNRFPGSVVDDLDLFNLLYESGTWSISMRQSGVPLSGVVEGDRVFLCVFFVDPPVSGTPVAAYKLLGLAVA